MGSATGGSVAEWLAYPLTDAREFGILRIGVSMAWEGPNVLIMKRRDFITILSSALLGSPFAARAQQTSKVPTVGILWHAGSVEEEAIYLNEIQQGLQALGYVEGRNINLVNTFANEEYQRFNANAVALVGRKVDIIIAVTLPAALAAQQATKTIPIVFVLVPDPVATKLVDSLARPGGNITGLSQVALDLVSKRLQLFKEVAGLSRVAVLLNPSDPVITARTIEQVGAAAGRLDMSIQPVEAGKPEQIERAFSSIQDDVHGVMLQPDGMFFNERKRIAEIALARKLSLSVFASTMVEAGALMSYAPAILAIFRRSAAYVDKIIKGTKPADLPVELPTKFEFYINLRTAKAIGLDIPESILARADKVIE
jgi:putative tryptophan/tyrosine transport system substrate-binding protein